MSSFLAQVLKRSVSGIVAECTENILNISTSLQQMSGGHSGYEIVICLQTPPMDQRVAWDHEPSGHNSSSGFKTSAVALV